MNLLTPELKQRIKNHEGVRYTSYIDSLGHPTIGIGHAVTLSEEECYRKGVYINDDEVIYLFEIDLWHARESAILLIAESIGNKQNLKAECLLPIIVMEVIIEMVFQLGKNGVRKFKRMWAAIKLDNFFTAAKEMRDSKWYRQTTRRVEELAVLMESADKEFLVLNKKIVEANKG